MNEEIMGKGEKPWDNNDALTEWILDEIKDDKEQMTGTEKQIKWAEDIKAEMVAQIDELIASKKAAYTGDDMEAALEKVNKQRDDIVNLFDSVTDAKWWIDNAKGSHYQWVAKQIIEERK